MFFKKTKEKLINMLDAYLDGFFDGAHGDYKRKYRQLRGLTKTGSEEE